MNKQKAILISILVFALAFSSLFAIANASLYSYDLDVNPSNDVPCSNCVTATATTNDPQVTQVRFDWWNPLKHTCTTSLPVSKVNGCFQATLCPDAQGDWLVYAYFLDVHGNCICSPCKWFTVSNYKLTAVPPCGSDVALGTTVTVTANTSNAGIDYINFTWINPSHHLVETQVKVTKVYVGCTYKYSYAVSTETLNVLGEWCVEAEFIDNTGHRCYSTQTILACRHCYFNVIPEIPLLGTVGASAAMLSGFAYKIKRKPKQK